jgi:glutathione S-transferase
MRIYNIVGTDGSWFSPYGWRARALLLAKRIPVQWVDVPVSQLERATAFAGATTTPLLVDDAGGRELVLKDAWSIARYLDEKFPDRPVFPQAQLPSIELLNRQIDRTLQIPGFAAWSPHYFSNGVVSGADADVFRNIVRRATGRSVEENAAIQPELAAAFRRQLEPMEAQLAAYEWLLRDFTYADILLLSCLKGFATVLRGLDGVLGSESQFGKLREWYSRIHAACRIEDPY